MRYDIWLGAITFAMAVLGAVLAIQPPKRRWHTAAYLAAFVVMGAFGMFFVVGQSNDAAKSQKAAEKSQGEQKTGMARLSDATAKINASTAETARVQALNSRLQQQILEQGVTIKSLAQEAIKTTTGGNSYPVLALTAISDDGAWPVLWVSGKYPLRHAQVSIVDSTEFAERLKRGLTIDDIVNSGDDFEFASVTPGAAAAFKRPLVFRSKGDSHDFAVRMFADNGAWDEIVRMRKVNGKWVSAFRVTRKRRDGSDIAVHEQSDPRFPRTNGRIDWGTSQGKWTQVRE